MSAPDPSPGELAGRRALVVGGGGSGIGRELSRGLAAAGADLAVIDLDGSRAAEAAAELTSLGHRATGIQADVSSVEQIESLVEKATQFLGGLDVVVTVVGGHGFFAPWVPVHKIADEDWERSYDINLRYVFRLVRAVIPVFLAQQQGGSIVSVGSLAGTISSPMSAAYGASKAGLINLARTVSLEYGRDEVRMNVLSLGPVRTPAALLNDMAPNEALIPRGRAAEPSEIADAVVFLASARSGYISGQNINIDGGVSAHFPLVLPGTAPHMAG
jgi:3-oxoacyl-[acyl-carrier protein] reductase